MILRCTKRRGYLRRRRGQGGFTLFETAVAAILAGALLTVCLQMAAATARQRNAQERRRAAVREAANAMERLAAVPLDELTPERAEELEAAAGLDEVLPGARLEIEVVAIADEAAEPPGKQITVTVRDGEGPDAAALARLIRWRYR